jgi:hypothetical protein
MTIREMNVTRKMVVRTVADCVCGRTEVFV